METSIIHLAPACTDKRGNVALQRLNGSNPSRRLMSSEARRTSDAPSGQPHLHAPIALTPTCSLPTLTLSNAGSNRKFSAICHTGHSLGRRAGRRALRCTAASQRPSEPSAPSLSFSRSFSSSSSCCCQCCCSSLYACTAAVPSCTSDRNTVRGGGWGGEGEGQKAASLSPNPA